MAKSPNPRDGIISESDLLKSLRVAGDAVLIGGQALAFWVAYFDLRLPVGPRAYISGDADFLGVLRHVETFAGALGGRAEYPSKRQISALHGAVTKATPDGPKILVDVLRSVVGPERVNDFETPGCIYLVSKDRVLCGRRSPVWVD